MQRRSLSFFVFFADSCTGYISGIRYIIFVLTIPKEGAKDQKLPWYFSLTASVIVILIGIYKKLNIGLIMLFGALTLGFLAGLSFIELINVFYSGLVNDITVMLVISIILLGILGNILKDTGALGEAVENLHNLVADMRLVSASMPVLIGMLTVPGGAILSAPLCAEAGSKLNLPPHRQAAINIWFRHVLYFILPIFPSLILASQISGVSISRFMLINLPLTLIGLISGFYLLFRGYEPISTGFNFSWLRLWKLIRTILPLIFIMLLVVLFELYFPLAIAAGVILALINYLPAEKCIATVIERLKTMIIPGIKLPVALVIIGIMVYKEMLEESAVLTDMTNLVLGLGIPVLFLIIFIPFLVGMLTGDNSASIAIVFPLFIPLLPVGDTLAFSAYAAYIYSSSTAGHIISPAHPCFALTKEYFKEDIRGIVLPLLPLLLIVMLAGLIITLLLERL
ncbi:MAG: DUF401 family protein [Firmicutes bacterium]|nr:DUF401 family protein [Bacillota bacterium]